MLNCNVGKWTIELRNEPCHTFGSADNARTYDSEYLAVAARDVTSRHVVTCRAGETRLSSVILGAGRGPSSVHAHSMVVQAGRCFVAVGSCIASLALPGLELLWLAEVDDATCFGVYEVRDGLISHGELEIARLSLDGAVLWHSSGADIFSEGIEVRADVVRATDFNGRTYEFALDTGACR